jgi:hypothetical protein
MLESLCNEKDLDKISDLITDIDFNSDFIGQRNNDHGVDAFYIDEESKEIMLFNFKFREKFNTDRKQILNDTFISTKLVNSILNESTTGLDGKLKDLVEAVIEKLASQDVWILNLYMVINEAAPIDLNETSIQQLKDFYDLEVMSICSPNIKKIMSIPTL